MTSRMVGSVLTLVILLFSVVGGAAQTYTQMQWGVNKGVTPYAFGANINGTWRDLGTVSAAGAFGLSVSSITSAQTGVYSNTQANLYNKFLLNGVDPVALYNTGWAGNHQTDALSAGAVVPAGSTVLQTNAVSGYVVSQRVKPEPSPGVFGGDVAGFFYALANASNANMFAVNPVASDSLTGAYTNVKLQSEFDYNVSHSSTIVTGLTLIGNYVVQPNSAVGFSCGMLQPDKFWTGCFFSGDGDAFQGAYFGAAGPYTGATGPGTGRPSQEIIMSGKDDNGVSRPAMLQTSADGAFILRSGKNGAPVALQDYNNGAGTNVAFFGSGGSEISTPVTVIGTATFNVAPNIKGSSTGVTTVGTANSSATDYTATLPANTGTIAETNLAQTFSATQTFSSGVISEGTKPTVTGAGGTCAAGTVTGGALVGTVALTGVCAATNTLALTSMPAATTGYVCDAADRTQGVVNLVQTATTTTGATFTFITGASTGATDVIQFKCLGY